MSVAHPVHHVGDAVRLDHVVVVRKTTAVELQVHRPVKRLSELIVKRDPLAARVLGAHEEHVASLARVEAELQARGVKYEVVSHFHRRDAARASLVVTVGGDGTFLRASHAIVATANSDGAPMLGVNSAASSSVGYFCATHADGFGVLLDEIAKGEVRSRGLWRLQVAINGKPLRDLALNDVLLSHRSPAETSRYTIKVGEKSQDHKSSGLWIATAAGSTAAIRSAGGKMLDVDMRKLQYRARELMSWSLEGDPLDGGVRDDLEVISRMYAGMVFLDGGHSRQSIGFADHITFTLAQRPMPWVAPRALDERRQRWVSQIVKVD
jgi:NAD+ kinase